MPIPPEHMKERLSVSYVTAVAAKAGCAWRPHEQPEYGCDGHFAYVKAVNGKYADTGFVLNCQIKSTCDFEIKDESVIFDMHIEDFNKIAEWEGGVCILILFCLPPDSDEWLNFCEDELKLKKCCYWTRITDPPSNNKSHKRVFFKLSQILSPEVIQDLLSKIRTGELQ